MDKTYYTNQINSVIAEVKKAVIGKDAIIVKVVPDPGEEIRSEGVEAKMLKALYNPDKPKE